MNDMTALSFALILIGALTAFSALIVRVTGNQIRTLGERLDQKIDQKVDGLEAVMTAKFETVDHRLRGLEGDMSLVKQHLLGSSSPRPRSL